MKIQRMASFLINHAGKVCLGFFLITALCAWQALKFEIDASAETLLVKGNRLYLESRIYNQRFSPEEFILLGYSPKEADLFSPTVMRDIQSVSEELLALERVEKVNAITNVPLVGKGTNLTDDLDITEMSWERGDYDSEALSAVFTDHPVYTDLLVNAEKTATAIQVVFRENEQLNQIEGELLAMQQQAIDTELNEEQTARMTALEADKRTIESELGITRNREIEQIYTIIEPYRANADLYLGGSYVLTYHLVNIITQDLVIFGLVILLVISMLLMAVFRDWRWLAIPLLCCTTSVVITTGMFGALGLKTTVISSNFIALQLILTLAIVIHLIVHYQHLAAHHKDESHKGLLIKTVTEKASPCFFAGATTSVGFAALLISNLQPVITFGWMMIVAVITSILSSLILFPCVLALSNTSPALKRPDVVRRFLEWLYNSCVKRPIFIVSVLCIVTAVTGLGMLRLEAENSFINYFSKDTRIRQELTFIDRELGGSTPLDIIYHPGSAKQESQDLALESQTAQTLQAMQKSIEQSPAVGKVMSVINFTRLARELNDDLPLTEYELNSLYTIFDRDLRQNLLGAYVDVQRNEFRISARIIDSTENLDRAQFLAALHMAYAEMGIAQSDYTLTNLFVLYQDILARLLESQINTILLVYLVLWLVMLCIFRSPRISTIALLPNIVVTVFILGLMGWAGIPLDLMTITIAAIAMGISIDDTIHFTHHYIHSEGNDVKDRLHHCFRTVGYALFYTSIVIAAGFSVLGFSEFVPSIVFGLLTAVAMLMALVTNVTLLPILLSKYVRKFS